MARTIFISYRRKDSQDICDRIYSSLSKAFGSDQVFRDIGAIAKGVDFRLAIARALQTARVEIVVIGPQWLTLTDEQGHRRLDAPNDQVRQEVELALKNQVIVVPVLVNQAAMPAEGDLPPSIAPLAYRNSRSVRPDPDFARDLEGLIQDIQDYLPVERFGLSMSPRRLFSVSRRIGGFALGLLTLTLTIFSLATWINVPYVSEFVRRLLGH